MATSNHIHGCFTVIVHDYTPPAMRVGLPENPQALYRLNKYGISICLTEGFINIMIKMTLEGTMKEKILIIEDDEGILRFLRRGMSFEGYQVETAVDGHEGLNKAREWHPDLIVLDWMLPGMDGLEVCRRLRASGPIPILMLTAKDMVQDRVQGLDAGADDYMVKPFELDELLARIRALLRRTQPERIPVLTFSDLTLDTASRQAIRSGREIQLTAKEYDLLELFMRHPRQVLTREMIFDRVWGYDFGGESNVLDVYIRYLRQKLVVGEEAQLIHTVRGVGYVLREMP